MSNEMQFLLYAMPGDEGKVQVVVKDETLWCTQKAMAQLFGVDRSVIAKHLKNVFETQELAENSVCAKIAHTAEDGKTYQTNFYHLDAIIAVGYRVNSAKATKFRQWATKILGEYKVNRVWLDEAHIWAETSNGWKASYPFSQWRNLAKATQEQRSNFFLSRYGIHWPELDEDLCFEGLFADAGLCERAASEDTFYYQA